MDWNLIVGQTIVQAVGVAAIIYCLAAVGLNLHFGYTGLLNFGQAAFLAVAAYGVAVTVATFKLPFWLGIAIGLILAVLLALLLGIPTLRLRADYLSIVTIAAAEIVRLIVRSVAFKDTLGGSDGINNFADSFYALNPFSRGIEWGPFLVSKNDLWIILVGWVLVALASLFLWMLIRSPWGRVIKGIREDEDAVRSLGKNVYAYKMQALIIGGVLGCLGGFVFAIANQSVQPDNYGTELTFFAWTILILGGAARIGGPVLGTVVFWGALTFIVQILQEATRSGVIPPSILRPEQVGPVRYMIMGLALMLLMIYRPQGIIGDKKELALDARR